MSDPVEPTHPETGGISVEIPSSAPPSTNPVSAVKPARPETGGAAVDISNSSVDATSPRNAGGKSVKKKEVRKVVPYMHLFRFADRLDALMYVIALIAACGNGVIFPLFTLIFANLLDALNSNSASLTDETSKYALYFLLIALGAGLATALEIALPMVAAERQTRRLRHVYLKALLRQEMGYYDMNRVGEVASRLAEESVTFSNGIGDKLTNTFHYTITFIAGLAVGFTKSWQLTLVIMATLPAIMIVMIFLKKSTETFESRMAAAYARAGDAANEAFSQIRTVAAYGGEEAEVQRYDDHLKVSQENGGRKGWLVGFAVGTLFALIFIAYGVGTWVGARLIITSREDNPACRLDPLGDGCFSGGSVVSTFMAVLIGAFALGQAAPNFGSFGSAQAAAYKIFEVVDRVPSIDVEATTGAKPAPETLRGRIEFVNVTFAYPSRPTETILRNFNLVVEPGTMVALVGESGSGKSTIMQLLQRFYDPQEGSVIVDGVDVKEWNLLYLRDHIGIVSQEPTLFGASVAENIAYGKAGFVAAGQAEIEAAAASANAHEFITNLPEGYDTIVGTSVSSTQLSGGQRQRICIARAVIRNPTYLLLDEATSALDTNSERVVQAALDKLMSASEHKRTTLVIAHRLSTITAADRIVVMHRGQLVEAGTHSELMATEDGAYKRLRSMQDLHTQKNALNIATSIAGGGPSTVMTPTAASPTAAADAPSSPRVAAPSATTTTVPAKGTLSAKQAAAKKEEEDIANEPEAPPVPASRVWGLQTAQWKYIVVGLIGSIASGVIQPVFAIVYSEMIGLFFSPDDAKMKSDSSKFLGYFFAIAIGHLISTVARIGCFVYIGELLTRRLRVMVYRSVIRNEIAFFDDKRNSVGRLNTRLANDAAEVKGGSGEALSMTIQAASAIVAGLIIAFVASWRLALVVTIIVPFMIISSLFQGKAFKGFNLGAAKALEESGHIATECMAAIRTVTAFNLQGRMLAVFSSSLHKPMKAGFGRAYSAGAGQCFSQFVLFAGYSLSFYAGGRFIAEGMLDFTALMRVFLALTMASQAAGNALNWGPDKSKADRATRAIFQLIDRKSAIDPLSDAGTKPAVHLNGHIQFRNVSFHYPSRPDRMVLENVNLDIAPGQKVALVGPSGSGKSTVVQLLERFYDATSGEILVDGIPIQQLNVGWLRSNMGLVQQEPSLMADSISYNIEYGRVDGKPKHDTGVPIEAPEDYTVPVGQEQPPADVLEAANSANATEFVEKFKHKFATHVGARGSQLSGGQKQRVAIARALVRHPQLLLCDEATSALDSQSESVVQAALDRVLAEGTGGSITVAHRLATIRNADLIVVVDKGHIVEQGTHEQLIAREGGVYRSLALAQDAGSAVVTA